MITLSSSKIGDLARCSTAALAKHLHRRTGAATIPLSFGSAWHKAMESWGEGRSYEEAAEAFRGAWAPDTPIDQYGGRTLGNGLELLRAWYLQRPLYDLFLKIEERELPLSLQIPEEEDGESVEVVGYLDGVGRSKVDGKWWGIEYKTTGRMDSTWVRRWLYSHQVTTYAALVEAWVGEPCAGVLVLGVETKAVPSSTRKCSEHGVKYEECGLRHVRTEAIACTRTPNELEEWLGKEIPRYAEKWASLCETYPKEGDLKDAPMEGLANLACDWCDLLMYCQSGKSLRVLQSFEVRLPNPFNPRSQ